MDRNGQSIPVLPVLSAEREPAPHPEDKYQAELLDTEIDRRTARVLTWAFVATLFLVPMAQAATELSHGHAPQVVLLARSFRFTRDFTRTFEQSLEKASIFKSRVQPRVQAALTATLAVGNDKSVVGRNGWLFYQPGVDYVIGPDITDPAYLVLSAKKRIDKRGEQDPRPDARQALVAFHRDAAAAGIHLVILPIPDKAMMQPEQLTARFAPDRTTPPLNNRGYRRFTEELRRQGVDLFDVMPSSLDAGAVRYLEQDTHWTPAFMDDVASGVAAHVREFSGAPAAPARYRLQTLPASRVGDLVDLLMLPPNQRVFPPRTIEVRQVIDTITGRPWESDRSAGVLLLGDSFTNIYSQPAMGWGSSAGFAEHLSYHLQRPIDVIAMNGGGASTVREELARRAASASTFAPRVIVYQFAMHALMDENWPAIPFKPATAPPAPPAPAPIAAAPAPAVAVPPAAPVVKKPAVAAVPLIVVAAVVQTSRVPAPGTAPYKDCLTFVRLRVERVESGRLTETEIIGAFWAMKDDKWLPAASYAQGDRLTLTLVPMEDADRQVQALQRADDLNDFTHRVFFVTKESRE